MQKCVRLGAVAMTVNNVCTAKEETKIKNQLKVSVSSVYNGILMVELTNTTVVSRHDVAVKAALLLTQHDCVYVTSLCCTAQLK
jgi:hypothetical protein